MKITINIQTGNEAFQDDNREDELLRILENIWLKISTGNSGDDYLFDSNGNRVGNFKVTGK